MKFLYWWSRNLPSTTKLVVRTVVTLLMLEVGIALFFAAINTLLQDTTGFTPLADVLVKVQGVLFATWGTATIYFAVLSALASKANWGWVLFLGPTILVVVSLFLLALMAAIVPDEYELVALQIYAALCVAAFVCLHILCVIQGLPRTHRA